MKNFKKIFAITVLVAILISLVPVSLPNFKAQKTHAIPVLDIPDILATLGNWILAILEYVLDLAVEILKKQLLDYIVDQIIQWIQGGGKPQFVTDWDGFLKDAANRATGQFLQEL